MTIVERLEQLLEASRGLLRGAEEAGDELLISIYTAQGEALRKEIDAFRGVQCDEGLVEGVVEHIVCG